MPLLIHAFAELAKSHEDIRLVLVGDGDDLSECRRIACRAGLGGRVELSGYRSDAWDRLRHADAFVLPSVNENMPLAMLEAMMCGLPCVASRVGGIPEALSADSGLLVAPGDKDALVGAMSRLVDEPGLAARLGARAARVARERFTIAQCADAYLALWEELNFRR
jgi:glycosyltransferase involved in cell wall biosynthesis